MPDRLVLAVDQGTSSTKSLLVDGTGAVTATASATLTESYPRPGWVEQSAEAIWDSVRASVADCLAGTDPAAVAAVGLSTQRESLLLWERGTLQPLGPVISWQDRRTAADGEALRADGAADTVRHLSGLPLDPMFSALKAKWLLDTYDPDRSRATGGDLCLGTVDSWLLARLGGDHAIEVGNAARTQLLDVIERRWSPTLQQTFGVPNAALPRVTPSVGPFPPTAGLHPLPDGVPVAAVLGDSHAALFAHGGFEPGVVKATYGTGSSVMALTEPSHDHGSALCLTVAWDAGTPAYAAEGNIRSTGALVAWVAGLLDRTPDAVAALAADHDSGGVHIVPAFNGLGAPWWDDDAVALVSELSLSTGAGNLARASLEAIAFQVTDVVDVIEQWVGPVTSIAADGGGASDANLMQLQADVGGRTVRSAHQGNMSALGAAHLAGLSAGLWDRDGLAALDRPVEVYTPSGDRAGRSARLAAWHRAVARARSASSRDQVSAA